MKKVLIIGMTSNVGGVETFICNVKQNISKDINMDFLVNKNINDKYIKIITSNNSKIFTITGIKKNIFKFFKEIFAFYKKNKYDVVHINECDAKMFVYAIPLLFEKKTKLIIHSHCSSSSTKILHVILKFFQNKRANIKWACSEVAYNHMFSDRDNKKTIIHNGIDLNKFKYDEVIRNKKRKELGITNEILFCSIARFVKEKNHKKIIDIFYEYYKKNKQSKLMLIGTGELQNDIKLIVKKLNIEDNVMFLNLRTDIVELLLAADAFLLPSFFEGLPFVSIEAQACSLPVFASNNVSKEIAITNLVNFIDLSKSSKYWANHIEQTLNNKINRNDKKYHQMINESGFNIRKVCEIIEQEYKE